MNMNKKIFITTIALAATVATAMAQGSSEAINRILQQVEANNKELKANQQLVNAQKLENRSGNNLRNPSISYSHLWDSKDKDKTVGEMVVSQSFDFPTLYVSRSKMNRFKAEALDAQAIALRQQVLLQAQEAALDIIWLHQQQLLLDERLKNAEELAALYRKRLETGDANILETNKVNLELLNARTEARTNSTNLHNKLKELTLLNGSMPLTPGRSMREGEVPQPQALGLTEYPAMPLPEEFNRLCDELLAGDPRLRAVLHQSEAARREVSVSKQGWLPQLEVGYRRNTESGHPLNGVVVGMSFPLFENRGKVKAAKAQALNADYQRENTELQAKSALWQLYDEATALQASLREYREAFARQQDLKLLKQALTGGEISMIEYFVEVSVVYQSQQNLLALENQYQKVMARLYQSRL